MNEIRDLLADIGLVDLVCVLLVVGAVIGGLRRGSLIGAVGSGLGTVVVLWLVAGALVVWGPLSVADAVRSSAIVSLVPLPVGAFTELGHLVGGLISARS